MIPDVNSKAYSSKTQLLSRISILSLKQSLPRKKVHNTLQVTCKDTRNLRFAFNLRVSTPLFFYLDAMTWFSPTLQIRACMCFSSSELGKWDKYNRTEGN